MLPTHVHISTTRDAIILKRIVFINLFCFARVYLFICVFGFYMVSSQKSAVEINKIFGVVNEWC